MKAFMALIPRDGLFCKDGRGWHTSASGRAHALPWPWPSTVLGALRTSWGRAEEVRTGKHFHASDWTFRTRDVTLGACVAVRRARPEGDWSAMWPVPVDALWLEVEGKTSAYRLDPRPKAIPSLGVDDDPEREALWAPAVDVPGKPLPSPRWWTHSHMVDWLAGQSVPIAGSQATKLPMNRVQVHVGIGETLTAKEGVLYAHDVVETFDQHEEWAVAVEVDLPEQSRTDTVATLGSDGRIARIEALSGGLPAFPAKLEMALQSGPSGLRLMVTTPACFADGWLPDGLERHGREIRGRLPGVDVDLVLRGALVPRPVHVSGWDMATGAPKAVGRMVPPGAVFHFERVDGQAFRVEHARALWLAAIGGRTDQGFGRVIPGVWNPLRSAP